MNLKENRMTKYPGVGSTADNIQFLAITMGIFVWWLYNIAGMTGLLYFGALVGMLVPLRLVAYIHERLRGW